MNRIVHASGLLVTLNKAQLKNHGYQTANIVSFVDIWDSFLYIQTILILRNESAVGKKWDFNLWIFRKFASQPAGSRVRRLKATFKKISCCGCMSSCVIIWTYSGWALGTALSFTVSLIFYGNLAVLCVLRLYVVLRLQGTSLSTVVLMIYAVCWTLCFWGWQSLWQSLWYATPEEYWRRPADTMIDLLHIPLGCK